MVAPARGTVGRMAGPGRKRGGLDRHTEHKRRHMRDGQYVAVTFLAGVAQVYEVPLLLWPGVAGGKGRQNR